MTRQKNKIHHQTKESEIKNEGEKLPPMATDSQHKLKEIYDFSVNVLDKRYNSYNWCEAKVYTLVTLNGLLMAALFFMIDKILVTGNCLLLFLSVCAVVPLSLSLGFSLYHIVPKMNSGRTSGKNIRTIIGTEKYKTNQDYFDEYLKLNLKEMIKLNAEQIRGMNRNIMKSQTAIRIASICSALTVASFLVLILKFIFK